MNAIRNSALALVTLALVACGTDNRSSNTIMDYIRGAKGSPTEGPTDDSNGDSTDEPTGDSADNSIDDPTDSSTDDSTENPTEPPPTLVKLGSDGEPLQAQYVAWSDFGSEAEGSQWACVLDSRTGLTWEVKQPVGSDSEHDAASTFTWNQPDTETRGIDDGDGQCVVEGAPASGQACNTQAFAARANENKRCGLDDWRIPEQGELESLMEVGSDAVAADNAPSISTHHFPQANTDNGLLYWSARPDSLFYAWATDFGSGSSEIHEPYETLKVRLVSGNRPPVATEQQLNLAENTSLNLTLSGEDPDGDPLSFHVESQPEHGVLMIAGPALGLDTPYYVYEPHEGYRGEDSFTFTVSDGQTTSASATISIGTATPISTNPALPTPIDLESFSERDETLPPIITYPGTYFSQGAPRNYLLEDSMPGNGSVKGYLSLAVSANTNILRDVLFRIQAANNTSEHAERFTFRVYEDANYTKLLRYSSAETGSVPVLAQSSSATLYLAIESDKDETAPIRFDLSASKRVEPNLRARFCDTPEIAAAVGELCTDSPGWYDSCDQNTCVAVNPAPDVDRLYICSELPEGKKCTIFSFLYRTVIEEIEVGQYDWPESSCETNPDGTTTCTVTPSGPITVDPDRIDVNTESSLTIIPGIPYGVDMQTPVLMRAIQGTASQQVLQDFFDVYQTGINADVEEDAATYQALKDYVDALLASDKSISDMVIQVLVDTGNGNEEAGATLMVMMNKLIIELASRPNEALSNDERELLAIAIARINERRDLLVTTAEQKLADFYREAADCYGLHCIYYVPGFPDIIYKSIEETDARLVGAGVGAGLAVTGGAVTYLTLSSQVVLHLALIHAAGAGPIISVSGVIALPVAMIATAIVGTALTVANKIESGKNEEAYNLFISQNSERIESFDSFIGMEHTDRVQTEIMNASIKMIYEMYQ